jgi:predicted short-subunit dehydrogenase-like oxidoreductase (DUF2520 family)
MVGSGALGKALCRALCGLGLKLDQLVSRSPESGQALINEVGSGTLVKLGALSDIHTESDLWFICVPDDAIAQLAEIMARGDWSDQVILHTSGAFNADVLGPLRVAGAAVGSWHPLQSFTGSETEDVFRGVTVGIEGDDRAVHMANMVVDTLAAQAVKVSSDRKALYHAAAALAGNAATTLMSISEEIWERAAGTRDGFVASMGPLIQTSVQNALEKGPETSLTGPIVRGDVGTLRAHLKAITIYLPHLTSLYGSIATETVHLAMRSGRLKADRAVEMLDVINDYLVGPSTLEDSDGE